MALAIDNRAKSSVGTGASNSVSFTVTAGSPLLVAAFLDNTVRSVTAMTYASEPLMLIAGISGAAGRIELWGRANPAVGTATVSATLSGTCTSQLYVVGTTGGDNVGGWRSPFTRNQGNGTGPGLTVTNSVSGDYVFHAAQVFTTSITFDGSEVVTGTSTNNLGGSGFSAGMSTLAAAGSDAVGCTDVATYSEAAVAVTPAVAGNSASLSPSISPSSSLSPSSSPSPSSSVSSSASRSPSPSSSVSSSVSRSASPSSASLVLVGRTVLDYYED